MTYPEQGPNELPPTVPTPIPGQKPPTYGYTGYPVGYPPPGYPPPGYPGAPYPPAPKRRTGLIIGLVVVLVLLLGGAVAATVFLKNLNSSANPTSGPSRSIPTRSTSGPTTPKGPFTGDLRSLLLPRPPGTKPWQEFARADGTLDLDAAAGLSGGWEDVKEELRKLDFQRGAFNHWTTRDNIDVLIVLLQFEFVNDAKTYIYTRFNNGIEDHDRRDTLGGLTEIDTYVANKDDEHGKRSVILMSRRGNIISEVDLWRLDEADVEAATELAVAQYQRLP